MEDSIRQKVEECFVHAETFFNTTFSRCNITFQKLHGLGYYDPNNHTLNFNPIYFNQNIEEFLLDTVPHEVAHAIDKLRYGLQRSGKKEIHHGRTWQYIMRNVYGINPDRLCVNPTFEKPIQRIAKRYFYGCNCGPTAHIVSGVVHGRIQSGKKYKCTKCSAYLCFTKEHTEYALKMKIKQMEQIIRRAKL